MASKDFAGVMKLLLKFGFSQLKIKTKSQILWKVDDDLVGAIICPSLQVRYVFSPFTCVIPF